MIHFQPSSACPTVMAILVHEVVCKWILQGKDRRYFKIDLTIISLAKCREAEHFLQPSRLSGRGGG